MSLKKADRGQVKRKEQANPPDATDAHEEKDSSDGNADDKHANAKTEPAAALQWANVCYTNISLVFLWEQAILFLRTKGQTG